MKITKIEDNQTHKSKSSFEATHQKCQPSKARKLRLIAILSWVLAIGFEIWAIVVLQKAPISQSQIIILVVLDLIFLIIGSLLWKKSNRLDPASSKDKFKFFLQNQLGVIISVLAFLPLVVLIIKNDNLNKKQKTLLGSIAGAALLIAGLTSADFNPPSQEKYLEQTEQVKELNQGLDFVYWTKSGRSYHLYSSCSYINSDRTKEIFEGTVAQARELKNITDICNRCLLRAKNTSKNALIINP